MRLTYSLSLGSSCVSPGCADTKCRQQQHYEHKTDQKYKHTQKLERYVWSHIVLMVMLEQQRALEKGDYQMSSCWPNDLLKLDVIQHKHAGCTLQPGLVSISVSRLVPACAAVNQPFALHQEHRKPRTQKRGHQLTIFCLGHHPPRLKSVHTGAYGSPTSAYASPGIVCVMQAATLNKDYQTAVAIGSLQGKDMLLRITKRPGFELDDVLESGKDERSESLWGRLTSWASTPNPLSEPALGAGDPLQHCPLPSYSHLLFSIVESVLHM